MASDWHGLILDHWQLEQAIAGVRKWFNLNRDAWASGGQLGGNALVIAGSYGTGKSHIAHTLYRLIGRQNAVFWEEPVLISALWESYRRDSILQERRIYKEARYTPFLILDDLGAAHVNSTAWLQMVYWQLFSYDPLQGRGGILLTTNLPWILTKNNRMPFGNRVGTRAFSRLVHLLGGIDPNTERPRNWFELFQVRDRRFDLQGLFEER